MILCDSEIWSALKNRHIIIDPLPTQDRVKTTSVDLTLGEGFYEWLPPAEDQGEDFSINPAHRNFNFNSAAKRHQRLITPLGDDGSIIIRQGQFITALTRERIEMPESSKIAARVEGRSSLARLGLAVHLTAPTIHCGFRGRITLEITNQGPIPIRLQPGLEICQLIFEQVFGTPRAAMSGMFQDQDSVMGRDAK